MLNNITALEKLHLKEVGNANEYPKHLTAKEAIERTQRIESLWSLREFMEKYPEKFSKQDYKTVFEMHKKNQLIRFIPLSYRDKEIPEALKKLLPKEIVREWSGQKKDTKDEKIII